LATKISFMNELAAIAERVGADIEKVRIGIGSDPRIGYSFIYPGTGYGGSCFPKDVQALIRSALDAGHQPKILGAVQTVNAHQKEVLFRKMQRHFKDGLHGRTVAVWGLSFKPNTDDMREAPSRTLIDLLLDAGARVQAYDPVAGPEAERIYVGKPPLAALPRALSQAAAHPHRDAHHAAGDAAPPRRPRRLAAGRGLQRGASVPGRGAAPAAQAHAERHDPRALRAKHRPGDRRRRA